MYYTEEDLRNHREEIIDHFKKREERMLEHIHFLEKSHKKSISYEEILEGIDIKLIEQFLRRKKMANLNKK